MSQVRRWAQLLAQWAIPEPVLRAAPQSPWVLPHQVFIRRADAQVAGPVGATYEQALAALAGGGSVLDVGAAAGASSLPLVAAGRVSRVTAVDGDAGLLEAFAERAVRLGVPARCVSGWWPEVAGQVDPADVVVCGNVVYNVAELGPFVRALTGHARRAVVVELAERHPLTELNPLWLRLHGIVRPDGPTATDLVAALAELGIEPRVTRWRRAARAEYATFAELVEVTRRRLCLPVEASDEVAVALRELGHDPQRPPDLGSSGRELVTLVWAGTAG